VVFDSINARADEYSGRRVIGLGPTPGRSGRTSYRSPWLCEVAEIRWEDRSALLSTPLVYDLVTVDSHGKRSNDSNDPVLATFWLAGASATTDSVKFDGIAFVHTGRDSRRVNLQEQVSRSKPYSVLPVCSAAPSDRCPQPPIGSRWQPSL
jgi:hypothetical protein